MRIGTHNMELDAIFDLNRKNWDERVGFISRPEVLT